MELVPEKVARFCAFQIAGVYWLVLHLVAVSTTGLFYKKIRFPMQDVAPYVSAAWQSFVRAVIAPLNALVMYTTQVLGFLLSSWQWLVITALLILGGYVMVNYQSSLFVTVDVSWTAFYDVAVTPIRTLANLAFLVLEILVGIVNFMSQYLGTVVRHTASTSA